MLTMLAMVCAAAHPLQPATARRSMSQSASTCSPYMPRPRLAMVIPSCAVAMNRSCRCGDVRIPCTVRAIRSPLAARRSSDVRGALTMANSAATNSPFSSRRRAIMTMGTRLSMAGVPPRPRRPGVPSPAPHIIGHHPEQRAQHVLERHQTERASSVVGDDGVVGPSSWNSASSRSPVAVGGVVTAGCSSSVIDWGNEPCRRRSASLLRVENAGDDVACAAVDGDPCEAALRQRVEHVREPRLNVDDLDRRPRDHQLPRRPQPQPQRPLQPAVLVGLEQARRRGSRRSAARAPRASGCGDARSAECRGA